MHLARTGGTSLMLALRLASYKVFTIGGAAADVERFLALPAEERRSYDVVLGHMPFGIHTVVPEVTDYATILRDPFSRTISAYNYIRMTPKHAHHAQVNSTWTLADYALRPGVKNEQSWWLAKTIDWRDLSNGLWPDEPVPDPPIDLERAKRRLSAMSYIGFFEDYAHSIERFSARFGLRELPAVHANASIPWIPESDEEQARTRDALHLGSRLDAELIAYAHELPGARAGALTAVESSHDLDDPQSLAIPPLSVRSAAA